MVDMSWQEQRDPWDDYQKISKELAFFNQKLGRRKKIIVANKMDLPGAGENLALFKKKVKKPVIVISALKKQGLEALLDTIKKKI